MKETEKRERFFRWGWNAAVAAVSVFLYCRGAFASSPGHPAMLWVIGAVVAVIALYIWHLLSRMVAVLTENERIRTVTTAVLGALFLWPMMNPWSAWGLIMVHVTVFSLLAEGIFSIGCRLGFLSSPFWNKLRRLSLLPAAAAALYLGWGWYHMHQVTPVFYTVETDKPVPPEGYNIALLSDLHYSNAMDEARLARYVEDISEKSPNVVLLAGDIVDERSSREDVDTAFRELGRISSAGGVYYVYGNHDKGRYTKHPAVTEEELQNIIEKNGIHILEDRTDLPMAGLTLSGRRDRSDAAMSGTGRLPSAALLNHAPKNAYHIIMDHQPREFEENEQAGFDLMVSGHTHRGQIWPTGLFVEAMDKGTLLYGHEKKGHLDVIVTSGLAGWGYPFRTEGNCEYVMIHVKNGSF